MSSTKQKLPEMNMGAKIADAFKFMDLLPRYPRLIAVSFLGLVSVLNVGAANPHTIPPTVAITSPSSGTSYTTAQTVTITATASDNTGLSKVEFYDGATLKTTDTTSPYSYAWPITSANNGNHSW